MSKEIEEFNNKMSYLQRRTKRELDNTLIAGLTALFIAGHLVSCIEKTEVLSYILSSVFLLILCAFLSMILCKKRSIRDFENAQIASMSQKDRNRYFDDSKPYVVCNAIYQASLIIAFITLTVMNIGLLLNFFK